MTDSTLTVHYASRAGAADRIMSLLRRRGFPIAGMTLERTHLNDVGRMTIVVQQTAAEQVRRHLGRLPDVVRVVAVNRDEAVQREYALARIRCTPQQRAEVIALLSAFEARPLSVTSEHIVVEAIGPGDALDALFLELAPYGIDESARTSPIALHRGSARTDETATEEEEATV